MDKHLLIAVFQSWPLVILLILVVFYRDIKKLLEKIKITAVEMSLTDFKVKLSAEDIKNTTEPLLQAMADTLKRDDKIYFSRIVAEKQRTLTVYDLFNKRLKRVKETHDPIGKVSTRMLTTLRALRGFGLIQPKQNKDARWEDESEIEVTSFGHFVSSHPELKKLLDVPVVPSLVTEIDGLQE